MTSNLILREDDIRNKIRRMAFQIYEANVDETEIVVAGIFPNGFQLTQLLKEVIENISNLKVSLCEVRLNKSKPINSVKTNVNSGFYEGKSVILVDDVLNSGSTLIYAVSHFLQVPLKQFKTAVLVDRNHKKYPVKVDYKGISLSTSISENVIVEFERNMSVTLK